MWSHSGGLSGACSDHRGESAGGAVGNSGSQTTNTGSGGLPNQCDANVSASSNVTCGFAENTFYEYYGSGPSGGFTRDEVMTAREVAGLVRMPTSTVYELARKGVLPASRLGRTWRFLRLRLEQLLAA